jgi:WD40 repeat protein
MSLVRTTFKLHRGGISLSILGLALGVIILASTDARAQQPETQADYLRGLKSYFGGEFEAASREFERARTLLPRHATPTFWKALSVTRLGRIPEALELLREVAAVGGDRYHQVARRPEFAELRRHPDSEAILQALEKNWLGSLRATLEAGKKVTEDLQQTRDTVQSSVVRWMDGHPTAAGGLSFSPDGDLLLSRGIDATAWLWNARLGEPLRMLGVFGPLGQLGFTTDGSKVFVLDSGELFLFDSWTGDPLLQIDHPDLFLSHFAQIADRLVTVDLKGVLRIHDDATGEVQTTLDLEVPVQKLLPIGDGSSLLSLDQDGRLRLRDPATGASTKEIGPPWAQDFGVLDDGRIFVHGLDGVRRILAPDGTGKRVLPVDPDSTQATGVSADGRRLLATTKAGKILLLDGTTGDRLRELEHPFRPFRGATLSNRFFALHGDSELLVWETETGTEVGHLSTTASITGATFSRDHRLAIGTHLGMFILAADQPVAVTLASHALGLFGTDIDRQGRVAMGIHAGAPFLSPAGPFSPQAPERAPSQARVFDLQSGKLLAILDSNRGWIRRTRFLPDGKLVLSNGQTFDEHLAPDGLLGQGSNTDWTQGFRVMTERIEFSADGQNILATTAVGSAWLFNRQGQLLKTIRGISEPPFQPDQCPGVFSRDSLFVPLSNHEIRTWSLENLNRPQSLEGHTARITDLDAQVEYDYLLSCSVDGTARIWDLASVEQLHQLDHGRPVFCGSLSDDGLLAATATAGDDLLVGEAFLWDVESGDLLHTLRGHTSQVLCIAFSPDSTRLVTASVDYTARLWDTSTGAEVSVLRGHIGPVREVKYSDDGSRIVTTSLDASIRIWDRDGTLLGTHVAYAEGGWLTFTPEGYYIAGGKAADWAQVVVRDKHYPLSSYAPILEDAEKVRTSLAGEALPPLPRLRDAPELRLFGRVNDVVRERRLRIQGSAEDRYGIEEVQVLLDGVALDPEVVAVGLSFSEDRRSAHLDLPVAMATGKQEVALRVRVRNRFDIWSAPRSLHRRYEAPTRSLYVLALGVQDYVDDSLDLASPVKDVQALVERLRQESGDLFRAVKVRQLLDLEVTQASLNQAMEEFLYEAEAEDTLVVFVAGHGVLTEAGRYFFLTPDATPQSPWTGIERSSLYRLVSWEKLQPTRRLLLIDTCHAGEEFEEGKRGLTPVQDPFSQSELDQAVGSGLYIVAGSTEAGFARETEGNGVFTRALLEGLNGAADATEHGGNGNRVVDVEELINFARTTVAQAEGGQRVTTPRVEGGTPFPLAKVP